MLPERRERRLAGNQAAQGVSTAISTAVVSLPAPGDLATVTAPGRDYISRGRSGDCCLLCGRTGVDLPVEHGCLPDLPPADLVRLHESADVSFMSFVEGGEVR